MALPRPRTLLGVINISPESMVSDSVVAGEEQLLERAAWLSAQGCGILDLGARSITPTAAMIDDAEEQRRLLPPLRRLRQEGYRISVDTWSSSTVQVALEAGATDINFTGGAISPEALEAVASADAAYLAVTRFRPASHQRLTAFLSQYGGRLTPVQLQRAQAQVAKADLTLSQLEAKTRATRTLARSGASTARIKQAADAAGRAFDGAAASTAAAMAEMQPMLQAKLSLFEGLRAKLELDQSMRDFAAVGAAVKAVRP